MAIDLSRIDIDTDPEEQEIKILLVVSDKDRFESTSGFLSRRGWPTTVVNSVEAAILNYTQESPHFVVVSLSHKSKKITKLPTILAQTFNANCIVFTEKNDSLSIKRLNTSPIRNVMHENVSGPSLQRKIKKLIHDTQNYEKEVDKKLLAQANGGESDMVNISGGDGQSNMQTVSGGSQNKDSQTVGGGKGSSMAYQPGSSSGSEGMSAAEKLKALQEQLANDDEGMAANTDSSNIGYMPNQNSNEASGPSNTKNNSIPTAQGATNQQGQRDNASHLNKSAVQSLGEDQGDTNSKAQPGQSNDPSSKSMQGSQGESGNQGLMGSEAEGEANPLNSMAGDLQGQSGETPLSSIDEENSKNALGPGHENHQPVDNSVETGERENHKPLDNSVETGDRENHKPAGAHAEGAGAGDVKSAMQEGKGSAEAKSATEESLSENDLMELIDEAEGQSDSTSSANEQGASASADGGEAASEAPQFPWERRQKQVPEDEPTNLEANKNVTSISKLKDVEVDQQLKPLQRALNQALNKSVARNERVTKTLKGEFVTECITVRSDLANGYILVVVPEKSTLLEDFLLDFRSSLIQEIGFQNARMQVDTSEEILVPPIKNVLSWMDKKASFAFLRDHKNIEICVGFFETDRVYEEKNITEKGMTPVKLQNMAVDKPVAFNTFLHFKKNHKFYLYIKKHRYLMEKQKQKLEDKKVEYLHVNSKDLAKLKIFIAEGFFDEMVEEYNQENSLKKAS